MEKWKEGRTGRKGRRGEEDGERERRKEERAGLMEEREGGRIGGIKGGKG